MFRVRFRRPELFSWLFSVAASRLNSPRLSFVLILLVQNDCQVARIHTVFVRYETRETLLCHIRCRLARLHGELDRHRVSTFRRQRCGERANRPIAESIKYNRL